MRRSDYSPIHEFGVVLLFLNRNNYMYVCKRSSDTRTQTTNRPTPTQLDLYRIQTKYSACSAVRLARLLRFRQGGVVRRLFSRKNRSADLHFGGIARRDRSAGSLGGFARWVSSAGSLGWFARQVRLVGGLSCARLAGLIYSTDAWVL